MEYRKLPHGSERVSVIGLGTSVVGEHSVQNVVETVTFALDSGVNYIDLAGGHAAIFPGIGEALAGRRKDAYVQLHFGADYTSGEYGWNPTLDGVKKSVAWQLEQLKTDYIDFGFMHCLDEIGDLEDYERNGILRNLLDLKAQERDYSVIATLTPKDTKGTCVYCKHCHPCPAGLDIGLINKYYDLSRLGDVLAKERYGCGSAACRYTLPRQDAPFFTKLRGEFITSQRADVGIGPYKRIGMSLRIRRGFFNKSTASRRAEQSPAPTNYGWLTRSNKERSCHALDAA